MRGIFRAAVLVAAGSLIGACGRSDPATGSARAPAAPAVGQHIVLPVEHDGLTILEAHWGSGTEVADVRQLLESQIIDGRVQMKADAALLGDPSPNQKKTLMVSFSFNGKQSTQYFSEGTVVAFGAPAVAAGPALPSEGVVPPAPVKRPPAKAPAVAPPVAQEGLKIITAQWGQGNQVIDVRQTLEDLIQGGRLEFLAERPLLGDAKNTGSSVLRITYEVRGKRTETIFREGQRVSIGVPSVGLRITTAMWGVGTTTVDVTEKMNSLIQAGKLAIDVTPEVLGADPLPQYNAKRLELTYTLDGKEVTERYSQGSRVVIPKEAVVAAAPPARGAARGPAKAPPSAKPVVPAVVAAAAPPSALLKRFTTIDGIAADTNDGVTFKTRGAEGKMMLADELTTPVVITARVKTDSKNIRLVFGDKGVLVFNWEVNGSELRMNDVKSGAAKSIPGQGAIPANTWATIRWVISEEGMQVMVDGVQRATFEGDYSGIKGRAGIATHAGAMLTLDSIDAQAFPVGGEIPGDTSGPRLVARPAVVMDAPSAAKRVPLLDGFIAAESAVTQRTQEGLSVRVDARSDGRVETLDEYKTPLVITAVMKTDHQNIRLMYGDKGMVILNWESNPTELRHHNPRTGENKGIAGKGSVPINTWVTIRWTIDDNGSRVEVDGVERDVIAGNFSGLVGRVGIGQTMGSLVTLKQLDIAQPAPPVATVPMGPMKVVEGQWGAGNQMQDVTAKLQSLAKDGQLDFQADVATFGDPAVGTPKELTVTYDANGTRQTAHFSENDAVKLGQAGGARLTSDEMVKLGEQRKAHPSGIVVVSAGWGKKGVGKDVADTIRDLISGDSLTVGVVRRMFGDGDESKQLRIVYDDGQGPALAMLGVGQTLQVGKSVTSYTSADGQPRNMQALLARHASNALPLAVLDAEWGQNGKWLDITDFCQSLVSGDSLTLFAKPEALGMTAAGQLYVVYSAGGEVRQVGVDGGKWLQLGREVTTLARRGKVLARTADVLAAAHAKYGDGLLILDASYGAGNGWKDLTDFLQGQIKGNRLAANVGDPWPDAAVGSEKDLLLTYWDGEAVQRLTAHQNTSIDLVGKVPEALRAMAMLPPFVAVGQNVSHNFGVKGTYGLKAGPQGAALSADGRLTWTPSAQQAGVQEIQFSIRLDGKNYVQKQTTEVVSKDVASAVGGDLSKLENLMRLPLAGEKHQYVVNPDMSGALVLEPHQVVVIGADGTTVVRKVPLAREYMKIGERKGYFVAIHDAPAAMDLLDKNTGKVLKTIKLDYRQMMDLTLAPDKPLSYVSAMIADTVPRGRIVQVNEENGEVREPQGFMGNFMAIDRSGKHLWAGLSDIYQNGTDYYVNPGFNIIDVPTYGNIDYLLQYDLTDAGPVLRQHLSNVGGNGGAVRLSPDGKRVTYLSYTGYPEFSKNLGAWDGLDFEKKPVVYDFRGLTASVDKRLLDYHPLLPLVLSPNVDGVTLFGRDTGDREDRVKIAPGVLQGVKVKDARFSPDGFSVILECQKGAEWFMYKVPLILSDAERATIKAGIPPEEVEKGAPVPTGGAGGVRT